MAETFSQSFFARWPDMDFNQHMRNAAYLGCSEDTRMRFLESRGFTMKNFIEKQFGPVVVEDKLTYKKELRLLEPFRVELSLAASTHDGRKMKLRNTFFREPDGVEVANVESLILWFDLAARRPFVPPDALREALHALPHVPDFTWYEDRAK